MNLRPLPSAGARDSVAARLIFGLASTMVLALAACTSAAAAPQRAPAPSPDCMDARTMTEVRQPAPGEIVVAQGDGGRFRVHFSGACPAAAASPDTTLLAREGWVCGRGGEYARVGETLCPIAAVERIDAAAYAAAARQSLRTEGGTTVLDTVTVRGERRRGFAGSPNYCLNPRYMRGWSEDREGLRVEWRRAAPVATAGIAWNWPAPVRSWRGRRRSACTPASASASSAAMPATE